MRIGKWVFALVALALLIGSTADAQIQANRLTIQNGGEYYTTGGFWGFPNHGGCRYFPSFAHQPSAPAGVTFPWKIAGWMWTGMQANIVGPVWGFETVMMRSFDNPYNVNPTGFDMSFDYPQLFALGLTPVTGFPQPIYGGSLPTTVPAPLGGNNFMHPSSAGGFDAYLNVFAVGAASWNIPSTAPYYGWQFAFTLPCASAITVPSGNSIWEYVYLSYDGQGGPAQNGQYLILSFNEQDQAGGPGNPGRNYTVISDTDNGYLWYWTNGGAGVYGGEWEMAPFVCDTVSIPFNAPGATNASNPFTAQGFDVGIPTIMPKNSIGGQMFGIMTEDYTNSTTAPTKPWIVFAAITPTPTGPINKKGFRLPHGWDVITNLFLQIAPVFQHTTTVGYPGSVFGTTAGGNTTMLNFPADPGLFGIEFFYSTYSVKTKAVSAGYKATFF